MSTKMLDILTDTMLTLEVWRDHYDREDGNASKEHTASWLYRHLVEHTDRLRELTQQDIEEWNRTLRSIPYYRPIVRNHCMICGEQCHRDDDTCNNRACMDELADRIKYDIREMEMKGN